MTESPTSSQRFLQYRLDELELSVRTAYALQNAGLVHVIDLVRKTEDELRATQLFSPASLREINEVLAEMGLALGLQIG